MPISPAEARNKRTKASSGSFLKACKKIDAVLAEKEDGKIFINSEEWSATVIEQIVKAYSAVGWNVDTGADRDSMYITFEPRHVARDIDYTR